MAMLNQRGMLLLIALACASSGGCAAITNPVADGIPVRLLPPELLGPSKTNYQTIPLNILRQPQPDAHRLDTGDIIGVSSLDFLGKEIAPPLPVAPGVHGHEQNRLPIANGHPVMVQEDGKIVLPRVPKISVRGMTIDEARLAIQKHYADLKEEPVAISKLTVSLIQSRQYRVLVFRQEATLFQAGQDGPTPISKRNTGHVVELPAYQNDVLHALARTGGLPDFDAYNEIIIHRDGRRDKQAKVDLRRGETVRIPLRMPCGAALPFGQEDTILRTGDVVFLEARDEQVFFTGGLLPPGKHMLPRDHDLDVIEAITSVRGPFYNGAFGGSNLAGNLIAPGLGSPSPSLLIILRRVPNRGQIAIAVDLREAMRHPQERIVIRPGDVLVLQEKPSEAFARYMTQTFFNFNAAFNVFRSSSGVGVVDIATPDRLPGRVGTFNVLP